MTPLAALMLAPVLVVAGLLTGACAAGGAADPSEAAPSAPTREELSSATYAGILDAPVTLREGRWAGQSYVSGGAARPTVGLVEHFALEGDLDGDGRPESAVLLWESAGGSGTRSHLAVMGRRNGRVMNLGTSLIGDRVQVVSGTVANGRVTLDLVCAGPGDAACCPTQLATVVWVLADGGLERAAMEVTGTLSLAQLAGPEWQLRELGPGAAVPDGLRITIAFEGGRVAGSGGCNVYFGSVDSKGPGELAFSATGTTMKACPEPAMEFERRYLATLARASRYSFHGGRLVLGCDTGGGPPVTLVYARAVDSS